MARRIELSAETWHALEALAWETRRPVNDLAEEALADFFRKHRRPRSLREALADLARSRPFSDEAVSRRKRR